ncbi:hypothetical protein RND81_04G219400 [Saponaria officinalis]|uniref:NAC domain-containing protein n=1 Tax=Saponaria officinalis TaxID=3572 RepID=A0AAW1LH09_SAPOF
MDALLGSKSLPPGFRFHPTDEELFMFYLKRKVLGKSLGPQMMTEINVFQYAPWELPAKACLKTKDRIWYYLCPRSKKYPNGGRSNRATIHGFWKSTGNDRTINYKNRPVGKIKSLIFHRGKAPKGERTDWVMYEYRLDDRMLLEQGVAQDSYVICKIYEKSGPGPKNGEHYGALFDENDWYSDDDDNVESDRGLVLSPEQPDIAVGNAVPIAPTTLDSQIQQPLPVDVANSQNGSVITGNQAVHGPACPFTPSTAPQPPCAPMVGLPSIDFEEDEIDRLLAIFSESDGPSTSMPEADIFNGLEDIAGGSGSSTCDDYFDWNQYLSGDSYLELKDLRD